MSSAALKDHVDVNVASGVHDVVVPEQPANIILASRKEEVVNYSRVGNDLLIEFRDGTILNLQGFFKHGPKFNNLVFADGDQQWLADFSQSLSTLIDGVDDSLVEYELLEDDSYFLPILGALAAVAGGIALASDDGGGGGAEPPPAAPGFVVMDDVVPGTSTLQPGARTKDSTPTLQGSGATPNAKITIQVDGQEPVTVVADGSGNWSYSLPELGDGQHQITVTQTDASNRTSEASVFDLIVDTSLAAVSIQAYETDGGEWHVAGTLTADSTPVLVGTATPNAVVTLYEDSTLLGSASADVAGNWRFALSHQADGAHAYRAMVSNPMGEVAESVLDLLVDTTAPSQLVVISSINDDIDPLQGVVANNGFSNDTSPQLNGTLSAELDAGESLVVLRNGVVLGNAMVSGRDWFYQDAGLVDGGKYVYAAYVEDAVGNRGATSTDYGIGIDTGAPTQTVTIVSIDDDQEPQLGVVANGGYSNDLNPGLAGTLSAELKAGEALVILRNGAPLGSATMSGTTWTYADADLDDLQTYVYTAQVVDAAGNRGPESDGYTLHTLASSLNDALTVSLDRALDDVAPVTGTIAAGGTTNDNSPTLEGTLSAPLSETEALRMFRDGVDIGSATVVVGTDEVRWSFADSGLASGSTYSYQVRVVDEAGNEWAVSDTLSFSINTDPVRQTAQILQIVDDVDPLQGTVASGGASNDVAPQLKGSLSAALVAGDALEVLRDGVVVGTATVSGTNWTYDDSGLVDGQRYSYTARVVNSGGNQGALSPAYVLAIDTRAPTQSVVITAVNDDVDPQQGVVAHNGYSNDVAPQLSGTLSAALNAGETVVVLRDGAVLGMADIAGTAWTFQDAGLVDGQRYSYTARVEDIAGNRGAISASYGITVDTSVPAQRVTITQVLDDIDPVQGIVANDGMTNDPQPELQGALSAQPDATEVVAIYRDGVRIGEASVDGMSWSFIDSTGLSNGASYSYTARIEDAAGNLGAESSPYSLSLQTSGPATLVNITAINDDQDPIQGVVANNGFSNDLTLQLSGTLSAEPSAGETVVVLRNGAVVGTATVTDSTWTFQDSGLADGAAYSYTARVEDAAGNPGSDSNAYRVQIDTSAPTQTVTLDRALDNVDPISGEIPAGSFTNDDTPTLEGSLSAPLSGTEQLHVFREGVDVGIAAVAGTAWHFTDAGLASGSAYTYHVQVIDAAGNAGAASNSLGFGINTDGVSQTVEILQIVDNADPKQGVVANGGVSNDVAPQLKGSVSTALSAGGALEVLRDGVVVGTATVSGTRWTYDDSGLVDGQSYSYTARVVNSGGNQGASSAPYTLNLDTRAPSQSVAITAGNDDVAPVIGVVANNGFSNDVAPQLSGTLSAVLNAGEAVVVLRDGVALGTATVTSTTWAFQDAGLVDGTTYTYTARVEDAAGNRGNDSAAYRVQIDTAVPTQSVAITAVNDDVDPLQGVVADNGTSNDQAPQLSGTLSAALNAGETVVVLRDGVVLGTADVSGTTWTFQDGGLANGTTYGYTARVEDAAGNRGSDSAGYSLTIDTSAPTQSVIITAINDDVDPQQGVVASNGYSNDVAPQLSGSLSAALNAGETVVVLRDGVVLGTADVSGTTWTFQDGGLANGATYDYTARVEDAAGNRGAISASYGITVDTSVPAQRVTITQVLDDVVPILGVVANGGMTNDSQPELQGALSAQLDLTEVVAIYRDGVRIGEADVSGTGWSFTDSTGLSNGASYSYTARVEDAAGNLGAESPPYTLSLQTNGPATLVSITAIQDDVDPQQGLVANNSFSNDVAPQLSGTLSAALGVGETVVVLRDGVAVGSATVTGTDWTYDDAGLVDGQSYSYTARVEDAAGNPGSDSNAYRLQIDASAPSQTVTLDRALDNVDPISGEIPAGSFTNDDTPTLEGSLSAPLSGTEQLHVFREGVDIGVATVTGTNWSFTDAGLASGSTYSYHAQVIDAAGNAGVASNSLGFGINTDGVSQTVQILQIVDDVDPKQGVVANGGASNDVAPQLKGAVSTALSAGDSLEVLRDGVVVGTATVNGTGWTYDDTGLVDGQRYSYTARVVNSGGNEGALSSPYLLSLDASAPTQTVVISAVNDDVAPVVGVVASNGFSNDQAPQLSGNLSAELNPGETVVVLRDGVVLGAATVAGTTWSFQDSGLVNGSTYSYSARVEDAAGNRGSDAASYSLTVDTSAPTQSVVITTINDDVDPQQGLVANNGFSNDVAPQLSGSLSAALSAGETLVVLRNGVALGTAIVTGTAWTFQDSGLVDGQSYSYTARVEDAAGNRGAISTAYTLNLDATAPGQTLSIERVVDDVDPLLGEIADGGVTNDTQPLVQGSLSAQLANGEVVAVYRDGVRIGEADVSGTAWSFTDTTGLNNGASYSYTARVEDAAGNQGAESAVHGLVIDTTAPAQTVVIASIRDDQDPLQGVVPDNGVSNDQSPLLGGTLSVALDTGESLVVLRDGVILGTADVSGTTWSFQDSGLVDGTTYSYTARVEDAAGNRGNDSAGYSLTVDARAPTQTVVIAAIDDDQGPLVGVVANNGFSNDQTPQLSGTLSAALGAGEALVILRDGVVLGTADVSGTTWTFQDAGLVNGTTYSYTARVEDAAGNRGSDAASYSLTVDSSAPTQSVVITAINDDVDPQQSVVAHNGYSNDVAPQLSGTLSTVLNAGETVVVLRDGVAVGTATVKGTDWTYDDAGLVDGATYSYTARVEDAAGNRGAISAGYGITIDTSEPAQSVTITQVLDDIDPSQGMVVNGGTTNDSQPELQGALSAQLDLTEVVAIYRDGARIGEASVSGTGWSFIDSTGLSNGASYSYTARVEDTAGNQGAESSPYALSLQTSGPATLVSITAINDDQDPVQGVVANNGFSNDIAPQLSGSLSAALSVGETLVVLRDGLAVGSATVTGTSWTYDDAGLVDGAAYSYTARVEDAAGNPGSDSNIYRVQIDTSVPAQTVTLDRALDNVDPISGAIPAGGTSNDDTPTLEGSLSAPLSGTEQLHVFRDGVGVGIATVTGTAWHFTDAGLASGSTYSYHVQVIDAAGNAGAASNSLGFGINTDGVTQTVQILQIVDDADPKQGVVASGGASNDVTPQLKGSLSTALSVGDSLEVLRDGVVVGTATVNGTSWTYDESGLADGHRYSYTARVVNSGGNQGALSSPYLLSLDTSAPTQAVVISAVDDDMAPVIGVVANNGFSNDVAPQLSGSLSVALDAGESVVVLRDGVALGTAIVTGTTWTFQDSGLVNGSTYNYTARVEDAAGNRGGDSVGYGLTVDTSAPSQSVVITAINDDVDPQQGMVANNGFSNDVAPQLSGTLSAALSAAETVVVLRDGVVVGSATVTGTTWTYGDTDLVDGTTYSYTARVEDAAGNRGSVSNTYRVQVDTSAPTQTVTLDRALDNVDPISGAIPAGGTSNDDTPTLEGSLSAPLSGTEQLHVFREGVDVGTATVTNATWSFTDAGLASGSTYSYHVQVIDAAGNAGPVSNSLGFGINTDGVSQTVQILQIVDDVDPKQGVVANGGASNDVAPQLKGSVSTALSAGDSLEVLRDGVVVGTATVNGTSWTYDDGGLVSGQRYSYTARVVNSGGNEGALSLPYTLSLDTSAPGQSVVITAVGDDVAPVVGVVVDNGFSNDPAPQLSGTLSAALTAGETVVVLRDGVALGTATVTGTTWTFQDSGLANGTAYSYTARVEDAAGNRGSDSTAYRVQIDTSVPIQSVAIAAINDDVDPQQGVVTNNGFSNDIAPQLSGSLSAALSAGERVVVLRDGVAIGTATATGTIWTFQDGGLVDGQSYSYTARVEDAAGNRGGDSAAYGLTIDTSVPTAAASIASISGDSGISATDFITSDQTLRVTAQLSGTLGAGENVQVSLDNGATWHDAIAAGGQQYVHDAQGTSLANGTYTFQARVVDVAGNAGPVASQQVVIDTVAPGVVASIDYYIDDAGAFKDAHRLSGTYTDDITPTLFGTVGTLADGERVALYVGDTLRGYATLLGGGQWSYADSGLAQGNAYSYRAVVVDAAGNVGASSGNFRLAIDISDTNVAPQLGQSATEAFSMAIEVGRNGLWSVISDQAAYNATGIKNYDEQLFDINDRTAISNGKSVYSQTGSSYGGITFGSWSLADYDRNGYSDIYTTDAYYQTASATVFIGGPGGYKGSIIDYWEVENEANSPDSHLGSVVSLDMNGDGYLDVIVGDSQGDSAVFLLNKGAGATGPGVLAGQWYGYGYDMATSFTAPSIVDVTIDHELSAVDIDNNGTLDFVGHTIYTSSSKSANALSVLKNSGVTSSNGSNWTVAQSIPNVFNANGNAGNDDYRQTVSLTWADFNRDGFLDLYINAIRTAGNSTSPGSAVFYNDNGVLSSTPQRLNDTVQGQASVAVDWDHDGDMDVIELPNSTSNAGQAKLYVNSGVTAGQVNWVATDLSAAGEASNGTARVALGSIASGIAGAAALDYDWDGDVDLLISVMGATPSIVVSNPNTPAQGTSLHLRILDQNGLNSLYGNTVQLYNSAGALVSTQIINAQSGMGVNDSSAIVNFYGLDPHEVYSAVLLRNVNGVSSDIGGAASLGSVSVETVNAAWGSLVAGAANHAYVLTAEGAQNVTDANIVGTGYNDTFLVGLGADSFEGGGGTATLDGVSTWSVTGGLDVVDYRLAGNAALTVDLSQGTAQVTGFGTSQTLKNIEGVAGAGGADLFTDSAADNRFEGRGGNDTYRLLHGGHDTLLFKLLDAADATGGNGHDLVQGFTVGDLHGNADADRIDLKDLLVDYKADGDGPAHYLAGVPALDGGDRIGVYLSTTQSGGDTTLNIDRDGAGTAFSSVPLLTLQNVNTDLLTLLANHQVTV